MFPLPIRIADQPSSDPPMAILWMDLTNGKIVGHYLHRMEDAEDAVGKSLIEAMERPLSGPVRRPNAIRVPDALFAAKVRQVVGANVPIAIGKIPELEPAIEGLIDALNSDTNSGSYLQRGSIQPSTLQPFFEAAHWLHGCTPWKYMSESEAIRVDIPAFEIDGACLIVIGALGESRGGLLFPSFEAYRNFRIVAESADRNAGPLDLRTSWFAFDYLSGDEISTTMLAEIHRHDFPIPGVDGFPTLTRYGRNGETEPISERHYSIAILLLDAFYSFYRQHETDFRSGRFEPVCETYVPEEGSPVRFTIPYEAFEEFDVAARPMPIPKLVSAGILETISSREVGRNDLCHCGSGKKYKKCHLAADRGNAQKRQSPVQHLHDLDARVIGVLVDFASKRFEREWIRLQDELSDRESELVFWVPWYVYGQPIQGRSLLDWYLDTDTRTATPRQLLWMRAQTESWLSVWEVERVDPGKSIKFHDLLTGTRRTVTEVIGSESVVKRDTVLARLVDFEESSVICGLFPIVLSPLESEDVIAQAKRRLRRKSLAPASRLRDSKFSQFLLRCWQKAAERSRVARATPPVLQNTAGDFLLITTDHFTIDPGRRSKVVRALNGIAGIQQPDEIGQEAEFVYSPGKSRGPFGGTVEGMVYLTKKSLRLEANSIRRSDELRRIVESACGDLIRFRARDHVDPLSAKAQSASAASRSGSSAGLPIDPSEFPAELKDWIQQQEAERLADWLDAPIPALDGKTPRESKKSQAGRERLELLLRHLENIDERMQGMGSSGFSAAARAALGLD